MTKKPTFIYRIRERLKVMLSMKCSPRQMALSWALGTAVGLTPYIGLQTYIVVALSSYLKIPVYPMLIGVNIVNPLTAPIYFALATSFGVNVLGVGQAVIFDWSDISISYLLEKGKLIIWPLFAGAHVLALVGFCIVYLLVIFIMTLRARKNPQDEVATSEVIEKINIDLLNSKYLPENTDESGETGQEKDEEDQKKEEKKL